MQKNWKYQIIPNSTEIKIWKYDFMPNCTNAKIWKYQDDIPLSTDAKNYFNYYLLNWIILYWNWHPEDLASTYC